jgi:AcrR family transcriptional regulator
VAAATSKPGGAVAVDAPVEPVRSRLSADQRREQLTEIGLELLTDRPIHELPLDEVAERAGISRTLLFHYFPTKSDFYAAVVQRAGQRLLAARSDHSVSGGPQERVRTLIDGYLRLVAKNREVYVRLVRGAAGGDPAVSATIDDLRTSLIPVWVRAAGWSTATADDPVVALLIRGWLVGLEEVALAWDPAQVSREDLTDSLVSSFLAITNA